MQTSISRRPFSIFIFNRLSSKVTNLELSQQEANKLSNIISFESIKTQNVTNRSTTERNQSELSYTSRQGLKVTTDLSGGDSRSKGGIVILCKVDQKRRAQDRVTNLLNTPPAWKSHP